MVPYQLPLGFVSQRQPTPHAQAWLVSQSVKTKHLNFLAFMPINIKTFV